MTLVTLITPIIPIPTNCRDAHLPTLLHFLIRAMQLTFLESANQAVPVDLRIMAGKTTKTQNAGNSGRMDTYLKRTNIKPQHPQANFEGKITSRPNNPYSPYSSNDPNKPNAFQGKSADEIEELESRLEAQRLNREKQARAQKKREDKGNAQKRGKGKQKKGKGKR